MVAIIPTIMSHSRGSLTEAGPSTTSVFYLGRNSTSPSFPPTSTLTITTVTSAFGPKIHSPAVICIIVLAGILALSVLGTCLFGLCKGCSRRIRRRRNTRQIAENPTEAQSRWHNRMKRRSGTNYFGNRSPEIRDNISIGSPGSSSASSTSSPSGQLPAYVEPTQPQRVFLNPAHTSSQATVNSQQTTSTLPLYHRRHHDELCQWGLQEPGNQAARAWDADPSPVPSYTRYWNP